MRARAALMCVVFGIVAGSPHTAAAWPLSWPVSVGRVVAVNATDGTMLIETGRQMESVAVEPTAAIRDYRGVAVELSTVHPGDVVAYGVVQFHGQSLIVDLYVTPIAPAGETADDF